MNDLRFASHQSRSYESSETEISPVLGGASLDLWLHNLICCIPHPVSLHSMNHGPSSKTRFTQWRSEWEVCDLSQGVLFVDASFLSSSLQGHGSHVLILKPPMNKGIVYR